MRIPDYCSVLSGASFRRPVNQNPSSMQAEVRIFFFRNIFIFSISDVSLCYVFIKWDLNYILVVKSVFQTGEFSLKLCFSDLMHVMQSKSCLFIVCIQLEVAEGHSKGKFRKIDIHMLICLHSTGCRSVGQKLIFIMRL